jgi:hypothetical protein
MPKGTPRERPEGAAFAAERKSKLGFIKGMGKSIKPDFD